MSRIYDQGELNRQRLSITAGLLATSTVAIIQMVSLECLDYFLEWSVTLFAVAIPALALEIVLVYHETSTGDKIGIILRKLFRAVSHFIVVLAFGGIVLHLNYDAGKYYAVETVLVIIVLLLFNHTVAKRSKHPQTPRESPESGSTDLAGPEHLE